jgi:hypothetical protein
MAPQWLELDGATDFRDLDTLCDRLQASEVKGIGSSKNIFLSNMAFGDIPNNFFISIKMEKVGFLCTCLRQGKGFSRKAA